MASARVIPCLFTARHQHSYRAFKRVNRIMLFECENPGCNLRKTAMISNFSREKAEAIDLLIQDGIVFNGDSGFR